MKRCPSCNRTYTDLSLNFCLEDGTPLVSDAPPVDPNATMRFPPPRDTAEPPPTEIYRPDSPLIQQRQTAPPPPPPPPLPQQQWSPTPAPVPRRKSNAVWWILGGIAAVAVIGVGLVVMLFALASMSTNTNGNGNSNVRITNRNTNTTPNVNSTPNTNSNNMPDSLTDDFREQKWGVGNSAFGRIWYADDEYHMSSKTRTYVVMYAPSDDYSTENATVKVTARSVDGSVPSAGFGLMVHGTQTRDKRLQDYALLIYPGDDPEYEVIKHKDGNQSSMISKTKSPAIRSGTSPNQLEIRIKGTEISFYINGQYMNRITDTENFKRGRAGLYTSDATEVAFDDMEIDR
jgi:hypothetical protein